MSILGFQLYVMLIEVFEVEKSRIRWYYFISYCLPLFITFISAAIYPQGYGTERHCWLQTDNYFIYSFVGPVIVVISVSRTVLLISVVLIFYCVLQLNLIFLGMAIGMMCKHASNTVSMKNKEHSRLASTRWVFPVFLLHLDKYYGLVYASREMFSQIH